MAYSFYRKPLEGLFMNTYHRLFAPIEHVPPSSYFAGGNSAVGYRAIPGTLLDEEKLNKLYILKGGPGTGKSTFMRKIAENAEERRLPVTYYYCASDPDSLDGIVISKGTRRIGVLDGTPPHVKEATLPGVCGEYVNLGMFWASAALEAKREEIAALTREKTELFTTAARYLGTAEILDKETERCIGSVILENKMEQAIRRLLLQFPEGKEKKEPEKILLHAHTMKGNVYLSSAINAAKIRCYLLESNDISRFYLRRLGEGLAARGIRTQLAVSPIRHDVPLAILLPEYAVSLTVSSEKSAEAALNVNMARFIDKNALLAKRSDYRTLASQRKEMVQSAEVSLQKAARSHFALEALYAPAMDFEKIGALTEALSTDIFRRLEV